MVLFSVVDPNALNLDPYPGYWLDPDPGYWQNLDPGPDSGLKNQFWRKKFKNLIFYDTSVFLLNLWTNLFLHFEAVGSFILTYICMYPGSFCIRIQYGSGSATLVLFTELFRDAFFGWTILMMKQFYQHSRFPPEICSMMAPFLGCLIKMIWIADIFGRTHF